MSPAGEAPTFDVKGPSFQDYGQQVRMWMRATHLDRSRRAAALILRMNSAARQVSPFAGGDRLDSHVAALLILEISKN